MYADMGFLGSLGSFFFLGLLFFFLSPPSCKPGLSPGAGVCERLSVDATPVQQRARSLQHKHVFNCSRLGLLLLQVPQNLVPRNCSQNRCCPKYNDVMISLRSTCFLLHWSSVQGCVNTPASHHDPQHEAVHGECTLLIQTARL
jgi:hypothetical protein